MGRELIVLRHAKSDWDTDAASDFERPLAKRGRRDVPRMARWLADSDLVPDLVVSSTALRAEQTTQLLAEELGLGEDRVRWDDRVYEAGVDSLLQVLAEYGDGPRRVMLVGHNPGFEMLVEFLGGESVVPPATGKFFPTAAAAYLRMPDHWSGLEPGCAECVSITRPKKLRV